MFPKYLLLSKNNWVSKIKILPKAWKNHWLAIGYCQARDDVRLDLYNPTALCFGEHIGYCSWPSHSSVISKPWAMHSVEKYLCVFTSTLPYANKVLPPLFPQKTPTDPRQHRTNYLLHSVEVMPSVLYWYLHYSTLYVALQ